MRRRVAGSSAAMRRAVPLAAVLVLSLASGRDAAPREARAEAATAPGYFFRFIGQTYAGNHRIVGTPDGGLIAAGFAYAPDVLQPISWSSYVDSGEKGFFWVASFAPDGELRWSSSAAARDPMSVASANRRVRDLAVGADRCVWALVTRGIVSVAATDPGPGGGSDRDDAGVAKFAADGTLLFAMNVGGTGTERPEGLAPTPDGDAVIVGSTDSDDFPVVDPVQPATGGGRDGFIARVRGDGTGLAWATYVGGAGSDDATAVAIDAAGDVAVTTDTSPSDVVDPDWRWPGSADRVGESSVLRLTGAGLPGPAIALPHVDFGGARAIAALEDGALIIGGAASYAYRSGTKGFLLRIDAGATAVGTVWHDRDHGVERISVAPDQDALLAGRAAVSSRDPGVQFLISTDLTGPARKVETAANDEECRDAALASDGSLLFLGNTVLARTPASGVHDAVRWRNTRASTTTVDFAWAGIRGDVASWQVEWLGPWPSPRSDAPAKIVATAPGSARRVRVDGLAPGTRHQFRVAAVLASGLRIGSGDFWLVNTRPTAPRDVVATARYGGVTLTWGTAGNGSRVRYEVQIRRRGGRWTHAAWWDADTRPCGGTCTLDRFPQALVGADTEYRVRTRLGRRVSRWAVSPPLDVPATAR